MVKFSIDTFYNFKRHLSLLYTNGMLLFTEIPNGCPCPQPNACEDENAVCVNCTCVCDRGFLLLPGKNICVPSMFVLFILYEVIQFTLCRTEYYCRRLFNGGYLDFSHLTELEIYITLKFI